MRTDLMTIFGMGAMAMCMAACSGNDMVEDAADMKADASVVFVPDGMTRATDTQFETGDLVGIYASTNDRGQILPSGNYASNKKYVYNNRRFVPSAEGIPVYTEDNIWAVNYYAVYPYRENQTVSFTFVVNEDQSTHANYTKSDLMIGYNASTTADVMVPLYFRHMLSQVVIDASDAGLGGSMYSLVFLSDIDRVQVDIAKMTAIRMGQGTKPLDIAMCNDGTNRYKAVMPPQKLVGKSVVAYVYINGKTRLVRLDNDINLHSGKSAVNIF